MTPDQLQVVCVELENLRREVQAAYKARELTPDDARDLIGMVRQARLFVASAEPAAPK